MKQLTLRTLIYFCSLILVFFTSGVKSQWVQTTGITSDNIVAFAVQGANLFTGSGWPSSSGVYLSTNGGNWSAVNTGLTNLEVHSLLLSGTNLFAATAGGVFRSSDNGASWVITGLTEQVSALLLSGSNLFAGSNSYPTNKGVFLSTNNGVSWNAVNGSTDWTTFAVNTLFISGPNLLAGITIGADGSGDMLRSSDNGTTWTAVTGLPKKPANAFAAIGNNLFAGIYGGGVYLSTNNGMTWAAVNNGLTEPSVEALAVSGANLFAGGNGSSLFLSTNNGTNWTAVNAGFANGDQFQCLAVSGTNLFAGSSANGVWKRPLSEFNSSSVDRNESTSITTRLSPNPTTGIITVHNSPEGLGRITITNMLGVNVMENTEPSISEFSIDLSKLMPGAYIFKLFVGGSVITKMIVRQ